MLLPELPNAGQPFPQISTAGRPSAEQFALAKQRGVGTVINLCPHSEPAAYDEPALVRELGLQYVNIPVAGAGDLNADNARKLADALAAAQGATLVHCASSNRVGALFALKAFWLEAKSVDEALAIGRAAGLRAMEPAVRQLMGA
ncbi:beta-lactamase hydrolase domain-containing protein [Solimonas soli]|uniref:beta-lactamase hydrolase domain-containing protein n=1 Tax=Solimonas soli TaxID=413479 RepID=UPI0004B57AB5|nr:sulfur transferase domain-containing protein [Solimonas soli]